MKLAKKIKQMEDGQVVKITASDRGFSKDVPGWCAKTGNELISLTTGDVTYMALISKGKARVQGEGEGGPEEPTGDAAAAAGAVGDGAGTTPDFEVNACGVPCPGPIMKLAKKIKQMEPGQVVRVTASDRGFSKDVPGWCAKTGNELLSINSDKGIYEALIKKADG